MVSRPGSAAPTPSSAHRRIVESAIDLFGRHGVAGTSIRAIAEQAGVSAPLVMHHFASKEGLREACDHHVVELIHATKSESIDRGPSLMPRELQGLMRESRTAMRYLARTLSESSPRINALMDELVASAVDYTTQAQEAGLVRPSADPRGRVIVLTLWMFGGLVLHEQMERLLGVDLLDADSDPMPYIAPAMEILTSGVLNPEIYPELRAPADPGPSLRDGPAPAAEPTTHDPDRRTS